MSIRPETLDALTAADELLSALTAAIVRPADTQIHRVACQVAGALAAERADARAEESRRERWRRELGRVQVTA